MSRGRRRKRGYTSSSSEEDSSEASDEYSSSYGDYDSNYDSTGSSDSSSSEDSDAVSRASSRSRKRDKTELVKAMAKAGLSSSAKKLVSNNVTSVKKARNLTLKKLTRMGFKEDKARRIREELTNPRNFVDSDEEDSEPEDFEEAEKLRKAMTEELEEEEQVFGVLRAIDMDEEVTLLKKGKVDTMDKLLKLTDKKLKKLGIKDKERRELLLAEIDKKNNNDTDSDEGEEFKIAKIVKGANLGKYVRNLQRGRVLTLNKAFQVTEKQLKNLGVVSRLDRARMQRAFKDYKESHGKTADRNKRGGLKAGLKKEGLSEHYVTLKRKGVNSVDQAMKLTNSKLKDYGIKSSKQRKLLLEAFSSMEPQESRKRFSSASDVEELDGESSDPDTLNVVHEALRAVYLSKYIPLFDKAGHVTLKEARKLTQSDLRAMGISQYLEREKILEAIKDYKVKDHDVFRVLIDLDMLKYAENFEKITDIFEAKGLRHADLRALGISYYSQRESLMKAFAKLAEEREVSLKRNSKKRRRRRRKGSESSSDEEEEENGALNPVEEILIELGFYKFLPAFEGIKTAHAAKDLSDGELRKRGLKIASQRESFVDAVRGWRRRKKLIG